MRKQTELTRFERMRAADSPEAFAEMACALCSSVQGEDELEELLLSKEEFPEENPNPVFIPLLVPEYPIENPSLVTRFMFIKAVYGLHEFANEVYGFYRECPNKEKMGAFLKEAISEEGLQAIRRIAPGNYPVSLEELQ